MLRLQQQSENDRILDGNPGASRHVRCGGMRRIADEKYAPAVPRRGQQVRCNWAVHDVVRIGDLLARCGDETAKISQLLAHDLGQSIVGNPDEVRQILNEENVHFVLDTGLKPALLRGPKNAYRACTSAAG